MSESKTNKYHNSLERLRRSGKINPWESITNLQNEFSLNKKDAEDILIEWVCTYKQKDYEHLH